MATKLSPVHNSINNSSNINNINSISNSSNSNISCLPFVHTWVIKDFQHFCDKQNLLHFIISEPFNSPAPSDSNNDNNKLEYTWRLVADIGNIGEDLSLYIVALQTDFEKESGATNRISTFKFKVFKNKHEDMNSFEEFVMFNQNSFTHRTKFGIKNAHGGKLCKLDQLFPNNDSSVRIDITIRVHINDLEQSRQDDLSKISNNCPAPSLKQFFNNPYFSDVTFTFDCGSELKASRLVLASKSTYFMNMFTGDWTESNQSKIFIKGSKYEFYKAMIYYFYVGSLDSSLDFDALMGLFGEADMCQIEDLIETVANKIVEIISNENWHDILLMGWKYNNHCLKEAGLKFVHDNWMNIKDSDNMKYVIENLNVEWMEELMSVRFFGIRN